MKVNFAKIMVKDIEGKTSPRDFSKEIGNTIFSTTKDIGELDLARDIYHKGEVDLSKEQAQMIRAHVEQNFLAWAKEAILPSLDTVINYKEQVKSKK